jgi:hypothetical protein
MGMIGFDGMDEEDICEIYRSRSQIEMVEIVDQQAEAEDNSLISADALNCVNMEEIALERKFDSSSDSEDVDNTESSDLDGDK